MFKVAALACVWAAAWCNQAVAAAVVPIAAAATAAAGGRSDSGNFLDDKQWLTTISQYDKEVGQWNKFRDVSVSRARPPGAFPGRFLLLLPSGPKAASLGPGLQARSSSRGAVFRLCLPLSFMNRAGLPPTFVNSFCVAG